MNKFMAIKLKHRKDIENYRISWRNPWFSQVFSCGRSPFLEKRDVILPHKIPLLFSFSKFVFVFVFWWTNLPQGRKIISLMKIYWFSIKLIYVFYRTTAHWRNLCRQPLERPFQRKGMIFFLENRANAFSFMKFDPLVKVSLDFREENP